MVTRITERKVRIPTLEFIKGLDDVGTGRHRILMNTMIRNMMRFLKSVVSVSRQIIWIGVLRVVS